VASLKELPLKEVAAHPFNPDDGLDMTEVAILAVVNNPDLRSVRDGRGIAGSQLLAAGVLPNPQLSGGLDHPFGAGPGFVNAFSLGLSYDIRALVTRSASLASARAQRRQIDWSVLWQEWLVVQKAHLLFIQSVGQAKLERQLLAYQELLTDRYQRAARALSEGNLTIDAVSANLAELQAIRARLSELEQRKSQTGYDLNALLGLAPELKLELVGDIELPQPDDARVKTLLRELPLRRPDLLALQAGYESQEQQFREAVLAQFPSFSIGPTRARDTSSINTYGFAVTISLPIFDRNQGAIAIAKATRQQLFDEYQARLDSAYGEVSSQLAQIRLLSRRLKTVQGDLPQLESVLARARAALDAGNMEFGTFATLQASWFEKRIEALTLEQSLLEGRAVLQTLLGSEVGKVTSTKRIQLEEKEK
jgi:outer membrane protein TolC